MTAKSGFNDGGTCKANCAGERLMEIANTLGRIGGGRCGLLQPVGDGAAPSIHGCCSRLRVDTCRKCFELELANLKRVVQSRVEEAESLLRAGQTRVENLAGFVWRVRAFLADAVGSKQMGLPHATMARCQVASMLVSVLLV